MTDTSIEWTDRTWNPVRGCSVVSEGCRNCYAMKQAHRFSGAGKPYDGLTELGPQGPRWTGKIRLVPELLDEPLRLKHPQRIFVNSMSDLFHEDVPDEFIDRVFAVMALTPKHTYQILTKRPGRMLGYLSDSGYRAEMVGCDAELMSGLDRFEGEERQRWPFPLPNVWLGVSVEDQKTADERIPILLQTPAAVRWISAEPLLGPVDLTEYLGCTPCNWGQRNATTQSGPHTCQHHRPKLDWVVVGGESGPGARPCDLDWIRMIVGQCQTAKVPVFVKQLGSVPMISEARWRDRECAWLLKAANNVRVPVSYVPLKTDDRKGGDPDEWPEDLKEREWPQ